MNIAFWEHAGMDWVTVICDTEDEMVDMDERLNRAGYHMEDPDRSPRQVGQPVYWVLVGVKEHVYE
jgi:hypothetical protein